MNKNIIKIILGLVVGLILGSFHKPTMEDLKEPEVPIHHEEKEQTKIIVTTEEQSEDVSDIIKQNAIDKWGNDYQMLEYEIKKQQESYNEIQSIDNLDNEIMDEAVKRWGNDYQMVLYQYNKQIEAKKNIGM